MAASPSPSPATKKNWVKGGVIAAIVLAFIVGIVAIYVRHKEEPATTPTTAQVASQPTETIGDEITLRGSVPIVLSVPRPKYKVVLEAAPGVTTTAAETTPALRPRTPSPTVAPPPAPKKDTVRVIVFNGLVNPLEVRYRNAETDPGRLAEEGASKKQVVEVGEEAVVDGVPVGEYLTVTEKDAAGKVVGTLDCKIDPDRGPVRMLHVRDSMVYYPRKR